MFFGKLLVVALTLAGSVYAAVIERSTLIRRDGKLVPNKYIVVFKKSAASASIDKHFTQLGSLPSSPKIDFKFNSALKGYSATLSDEDAATLAASSIVEYVEQEQYFEALGSQANAPSWGLSRISASDLGPTTFYYPNSAGSGVDAYIIDTGINVNHTDFGGRAKFGYSSVGGSTDQNGHGTHVAGTVGGTTYGVAKKVNLIAVKVFTASSSTTTSAIVSGIDWATSQVKASGKKSVANLSLGGSASTSLDTAVNSLISAGAVVAVAAGNSYASACNYSPARVSSAITVAASTSSDSFATAYSNYGSCVDIIAPGSSIVSDYYSSNTAVATLSGTSMASPHVAGVAALVFGAGLATTNSGVSTWIVNNAINNTITSVPSGTPNKFLYIGGISTSA